jgi:hypothetical protein
MISTNVRIDTDIRCSIHECRVIGSPLGAIHMSDKSASWTLGSQPAMWQVLLRLADFSCTLDPMFIRQWYPSIRITPAILSFSAGRNLTWE